ncbi:MAG: CDP-glucose 4,6-dehydratase [Gammaproteobacteria bacterium]
MDTGPGALESMVIDSDFWRGREVLLTGHTGFKGSWLSLWMNALGARVTGLALAPPSEPNLYHAASVSSVVADVRGDVRDLGCVSATISERRPEVIFHLAAQSLVRESYQNPVETYATNVMGVVNVLEAARRTDSVKVVVIVTSDKCYENSDADCGHRESDAMGGFDPYSSSKGCAELVTAAMRRSFFQQPNAAVIASTRAGNVIGGGDWAADRLVPDLITAFHEKRAASIRNPAAVRPWQHVLEPLAGYLLLAQSLYARSELAGGWNFGPALSDAKPVGWVADRLVAHWGGDAGWGNDGREHPHEAQTLRLDCSKALTVLGWAPRLSLDDALRNTAEWYRAWLSGRDMREFSLQQIDDYQCMGPR